jgi:murein DD-endopeptidase MepM/ murein hydrolase activator NlpD
VAAALVAALLLSAAAEVAPPRARPGDAVVVTVRGAPERPEGALLGRPLRFFEAGPDAWQAVAPLPTETGPGSSPLAVSAAGEPLPAALEVAEPGFRATALDVPPRFLEPPPSARRRIEADQRALAAAYDRPFGPPRFGGPFARPREAEATGRYGDQRTYNGATAGVHYGVDLAAPAGAPVAAANDGQVVLARDCYQSGKTVLVWHGAGIFTAYLHLSRMDVRPGEAVRRGQVVGLVGSTGRSTGPHLHWGAKVDGLWVDPESLLRLDLSGGAGGAP